MSKGVYKVRAIIGKRMCKGCTDGLALIALIIITTDYRMVS
jgi:hypothetical protein